MGVSIRPKAPLMRESALQHSHKATRNCPVCVSGLLTLAERDGPLDLYTCIACGASVSLRHKTSMSGGERADAVDALPTEMRNGQAF
jgi:hypothetical protein